MSKPDKQRVGLQRKVSSVFKGVAIPGENCTDEPSSVPTDDNGATPRDAMPENGRIPTTRQREEDILPEPEATQSPVSENPVPPEEPTDNVDPKTTAESAPPVPKTPQTAQSSLMKKLSQSEERADTVVCPPSVSAEPEVAQSSATDKTIPDKAGDSAQQSPNNKQTSKSSLIKRLEQSDEPANEAVSDGTADTAVATTPKREPSLNHKLKNDRIPEAAPASSAQNMYPLADSFADSDEGGGFLEQIKEKLIPSEEEGGSTKDKVMVMLVPILAIVMIFMFRQVLQKSPGKVSAVEKKEEKVVAAAELSGEIEWEIPDPLPAMTRDPLKLSEQNNTENPDEVAGPTNPGQETKTTTAARIRSGVVNVRDIVYSEDKASALIGNRIVYAGSKIDGVTIVKINRDSVEFESNGETWVQRVRD